MGSRLILVQARMSSSRLPGKVLLPLAGKPLLVRMIERVRAAIVHARIVVITSQDKSDDAIESLCNSENILCYRGHLTDLLDRHYQAAKAYGAEVVAKIPSDCPLIDPRVIERVFGAFDSAQDDYTSNLHPASYPDGNDVEVMRMSAIEAAWREAEKDFEREHTTPFIWERPERFRIANVNWHSNYAMTHRWTIDYPEDYEFIRTVYDKLYSDDRPIFSLEDILGLLYRRPDIAEINQKYVGVNWYRKHLGELRTIALSETRMLEGESV